MAVQDQCTIMPVISKTSADFVECLFKAAKAKCAKLAQCSAQSSEYRWRMYD